MLAVNEAYCTILSSGNISCLQDRKMIECLCFVRLIFLFFVANYIELEVFPQRCTYLFFTCAYFKWIQLG